MCVCRVCVESDDVDGNGDGGQTKLGVLYSCHFLHNIYDVNGRTQHLYDLCGTAIDCRIQQTSWLTSHSPRCNKAHTSPPYVKYVMKK